MLYSRSSQRARFVKLAGLFLGEFVGNREEGVASATDLSLTRVGAGGLMGREGVCGLAGKEENGRTGTGLGSLVVGGSEDVGDLFKRRLRLCDSESGVAGMSLWDVPPRVQMGANFREALGKDNAACIFRSLFGAGASSWSPSAWRRFLLAGAECVCGFSLRFF